MPGSGKHRDANSLILLCQSCDGRMYKGWTAEQALATRQIFSCFFSPGKQTLQFLRVTAELEKQGETERRGGINSVGFW